MKRFVLTLLLPLLGVSGLQAKPFVLPTRGQDEVAQTYATVSWPDPRNPRFVSLGSDQFLLSTSTGMQRWDAKSNIFSQVKDWPTHAALGSAWARLGDNRLLVAASHNEKDMPLHSVLWWNAKTRHFSTPLPLRQGMLVHNLVAIDADHALVCMRTEGYRSDTRHKPADPAPFAALVVSLRDGALIWNTENSDQLSALILAADVRGPVEGLEDVKGALTAELPPVHFNTQFCKWEMKNLPNDLREAPDLTIKHYRLPDGRTLIGHADWYSPSRNHRRNLAAPLLWNDKAGRWDAIDNTAQEGNSGDTFNNYDIRDSIVSVPTVSPEFVEFLDPETLRWTRSRQKFQETYGPRVAPLSTGQALVFLSEQGRILLLDPMRENVPGHFAYNHSRWGEVKLRNGRVFLGGGGSVWHPDNRPEIVTPATLRSKPVAPLPQQLGFLSGVELPDKTVLVFGGLPPGCGPSTDGDNCGKKPAQPSYRYFPREDRWELVPGLAIFFANGQFWDTGNSDISSQWPRNDALLRRNGDFVFLDSGTTLTRWRPGIAPQPLASLRQRRTYPTLLELSNGRLAVIGGLAQPANEFARTTEIFSAKADRWKPGPRPKYAGGRAVKLANGRIFKLSMKDWWATGGYQAEVANAAFTRWKKLPAFPLKSFNVGDVVVVGNRVLLLPARPDRNEKPIRKVIIWNDSSRTWAVSDTSKIWKNEPPLAFTPLNSGRALVRSYNSFEVVAIPH